MKKTACCWMYGCCLNYYRLGCCVRFKHDISAAENGMLLLIYFVV